MDRFARWVVPLLLALAWLSLAASRFDPSSPPWDAAALWAIMLAVPASAFFPALQFFGRVWSRRQGESQRVALTFDDGPDEVSTPRVLDALDVAGAKATFFVIGERVRRAPHLVAEIVRRGHQLAQHSSSHDWRLSFRERALAADLRAADEAIWAAAGVRPRWYRPPIGLTPPPTHNVARQWGLELAGWSVRPYDARGLSAAEIREAVSKRTRGGDVVLLHDAAPFERPDRVPNTPDALPAVLTDLAAHGLRSVTLAELFDCPAYRTAEESTMYPKPDFRRQPVQIAVWLTVLALVLSLATRALAMPLAFASPIGVAMAAELPPGLVAASERLAKNQTVRARFTQTKTSSLFVDAVTRTGTLELRRSDSRLVWTYDDGPAFLLAGGKFFPAGVDEGRAGKEGTAGFAPPGGGPFGEVMEALFTLQAVPLAKHFLAEETAPDAWRLSPRMKGGSPFVSVDMAVGGEPFALLRVVLTESGGDATTVTFSDIEPNAALPDERFRTPAERSKAR
jgi:peptidoglycan/xylan/chitin deacetylase (PgdA/CDA1 family)/outer membrane lipoprotein-sorting protein